MFDERNLFAVSPAAEARVRENERMIANANRILIQLAFLCTSKKEKTFRCSEIAQSMGESVQLVSYYLNNLLLPNNMVKQEVRPGKRSYTYTNWDGTRVTKTVETDIYYFSIPEEG